MHPFRKLILISLGKETRFEKAPTHTDWAVLYNTARHQALLGVLYDGILRLPDDQKPPEHILAEWGEAARKIGLIHDRHVAHARELEDILTGMGLRGCILKGTGLAELYPDPSRRMCGDIDLWVIAPRQTTLKAFSDRYHVHGVLYQECKAFIFSDTLVEVHFHPTKMYNPRLNRRLQRTLERLAPPAEAGTLVYPSARFNAVFCMAHMLRHFLEGGIGLRQMMDYSFVLQQLTPEDRAAAMEDLERLGMKRFAGAVMHVLQKCFALDEEYFLCPQDDHYGHELMKEILHSGNFGTLDRRNRPGKGENKWKRFRRKNSRVRSYMRSYPREVLWSPFARISQYVWRVVSRKK